MNNTLTRFFGGSPARVLLQLVILSVILGGVLNVLGVSPDNIIARAVEFVRHIYDTGFDTFVWLWRYFLLGAVIVFPLWLLMRVLRLGRRTPQV